MEHMGTCLFQDLHLGVIQPDAVRHLNIWTDHTDMLKVFQVAPSTLTQHLGYLFLNLAGMTMDSRPAVVSLLLYLFEQTIGVPELPTRGKAIADTSIRLAMPSVEQVKALPDGCFGCFLQGGRQVLGQVHHGFASLGTDA